MRLKDDKNYGIDKKRLAAAAAETTTSILRVLQSLAYNCLMAVAQPRGVSMQLV